MDMIKLMEGDGCTSEFLASTLPTSGLSHAARNKMQKAFGLVSHNAPVKNVHFAPSPYFCEARNKLCMRPGTNCARVQQGTEKHTHRSHNQDSVNVLLLFCR